MIRNVFLIVTLLSSLCIAQYGPGWGSGWGNGYSKSQSNSISQSPEKPYATIEDFESLTIITDSDSAIYSGPSSDSTEVHDGSTGLDTVAIKQDELPLVGFRRVENIMGFGDAFGHQYSGTNLQDPADLDTISHQGADVFLAPSDATADSVVWNATSVRFTQRNGNRPAGRLVFSCTLKEVTANGDNLTMNNDPTKPSISPTGSFVRYGVHNNFTGGQKQALGFGGNGMTVNSQFIFKNWMFEILEENEGQNAPSEFVHFDTTYNANVSGVKYFDTNNGNTVASNIVTEASGSALSGYNQGYAPLSGRERTYKLSGMNFTGVKNIRLTYDSGATEVFVTSDSEWTIPSGVDTVTTVEVR